MAKYLDNDGLLYFWQKIKNLFALKTDVPSASSTSPKMNGTAAVGTETTWAHGDHVHPVDTSRAPTSHASSATTYGKGTNSNYGHVKLSDATNGTTAAASGGTAATPKAVSDALQAAKDYADGKADTDTTYTLSQDATDGHKITLTPSSGTAQTVTIPDNDTTYSDFGGATASAAGTHGLVPAPAAGNEYSVIMGGGEWKPIALSASVGAAVTLYLKTTENNEDKTISTTSIPSASTTNAGVMSKADKAKLNGIEEGANAYIHPSYDAASAAAVKVGRDATGHVVIGDALTASDVGASATGHKHAAGDITSGTLGVARGGTGASTLGAGVVYHASSGTGALSIASAANIVSAIGNTAVNRATADASGNNIADTYAKKTDIAGVYKYKGSVATESALPASPATGDVYNIESASSYGAAGANVAWNGTAWDSLGEIFTIASITNAEIDTIVAS